MTIKQFIEFMVDLANDELESLVDRNAQLYFLNGGCLEFARALNSIIPGSSIVINEDSEHCGVLYKGRVYDASGDITNKIRYRIANKEDLEYMEDRFGIPEKKYIDGVRASDCLVNEINKCNILKHLELNKKEEEREK